VHASLAAGCADVGSEIDRLIGLTDVGMADLRDYASALKSAQPQEGSLPASMRRYAEKFVNATGIAVRVEVEGEVRVSDRLAAEVFQIAAEGLSNVRRHTSARQATVVLTCRDDQLVLRVANDVAAGSVPVSFTPRSITERATALGGHAQIESTEDGTTVAVQIPL